MNIKELKVGMQFKNYKALCEFLGIEPITTGGNAKKAHLTELERYFVYEKQGQKFIILEVFEVPKEQKCGNNIPYVKYIEALILDLLVQGVYKGQDEVFLSKNQLLKEFKMINENYAFCKANNYRILKLSKFSNINRETIEEWYLSTDTTLKNNLERALENLKSQSLILWSSEITVCKANISEHNSIINKKIQIDEYDEETITYKANVGVYLENKEATKDEKKFIIHTEHEVMANMDVETKQQLVKNGLWDVFKKKVNEILLKELGISFYYDSYKIVFNEDHIQNKYEKLLDELLLLSEERSNTQAELNLAVSDRLKNNSIKKQDRALSETKNIIGNIKDDKLKRRSNQDYILDTEKLIDILINKNSKNIKQNIKKTKINN
jgi:hypothetical protein